jgi:hypothetical protein
MASQVRSNPPIHTDASKRRRGLLARVIGTRWTVNVVGSSQRPTVGNVWPSGVTPCGGEQDD